MTRWGNGLGYMALAVSIVALVVSLLVYTSRRPGAGPETGAPRPAPSRVALSMVVATFSGQGVFAHRWYPTMMVVREGDTVDLVIANPDEFSHQFELPGYGIKTKILNAGESERVTFVADQVGVFEYRCALPYDPGKKHCTPDHDEMRGYLIVTK
ncbi:MAG: cupredoxin domain-containing protein [Armatimonadota bacterium]|nr:cupredoxin domain-containing protein [Armatimonadota bacterium]MDR7520769.1 cupredoxin domain-containing protein [Armatimonadota bacterium]MDR7550004.1 cupredoxin domain-containing protein [Armatimonadota bacterium]